jgi:hypothetical protein
MTDHLPLHLPFAGALLALALTSVSGCADLRWDRAIYQGMKFSGEHCAIKLRADTATCADLPNRDQYERERASLKPIELPLAVPVEVPVVAPAPLPQL